MSRDYAAQPNTQVRRSDRAVEDEAWMVEMLSRVPVGYLATTHDGQPFINSNLYVYDAARHCIYMHTARVGRTRANVDAAEKVCFTISEIGRLLPADEALEFSVEYSGIVAFGTAHVVTDRDEQVHALQILLDRYFPHLQPGRDYRGIIDEELTRTSVFRIDISEWSGKRKKIDGPFAGAFEYPYSGSVEQG
ncbi:MAG: pyridoxamine 5'-phosphate oxidase family protein [Pleurocapsa minor GSE-CHR-MK-17-07R]|jgi:nitroimidazol reductase NimA-like FMN-containing flavoprotein (pyridoxamine 5'-phosphate oxidase superfamily)|nr:pyridoxamine 5'-phosphate oxidase family protein [Pleurocapsa minor GSE-CHR-MK 17-07R]